MPAQDHTPPAVPSPLATTAGALEKHAVIIRDFLCCLFKPDEQIHIQAMVGEERYGHLLRHPGEMPVLTASNRRPRRTMSFSRKAASLRTRTLRDLHILNRAGWDIYFCINPLTCGRRCQKTVRVVRHILLESDSAPLGKQRDILLNVFGPQLSAIQWTGGRSIHGYLRLSGEIRNPARVGWRMARLLKGDTACRIPAYDPVADYWIRTMAAWGLDPDQGVIKDFSRLSRLPGFIHSGTGGVSCPEMMNPHCQGWMIPDPPADDDGYQPTFEEWEAGLAGMEEALRESLDEGLGGSVTGGSCPSAAPSEGSVSSDSSGSSFTPTASSPATTPIGMNIVCETGSSGSPRGSFLDDLEGFGRIRTGGIPARHRRRGLHRLLFTAARVFGWDSGRMASEWRQIVSITPGNSGETPEDAVADMLRHWGAVGGRGRIYLPDLGRLPDMTVAMEESIRAAVIKMGCPCARSAALILSRVIWPKVGQASVQCLEGSVNLQAAAMRDACPDRRYRAAVEWLTGGGMLECTNAKYLPGTRTRTYRVNVPLLLWMAGLRTRDLVWDRACRGDWRDIGVAAA